MCSDEVLEDRDRWLGPRILHRSVKCSRTEALTDPSHEDVGLAIVVDGQADRILPLRPRPQQYRLFVETLRVAEPRPAAEMVEVGVIRCQSHLDRLGHD